uniref:Protein-tyrosine phosphatase n=1 Tax=Anisakis simplex TaxID=6269 RepID=A0A0M3KIN6_ANISI
LYLADLRIEFKSKCTLHKGRITKTEILVSNGDINLTVMHYHWTEWQDFKVPNDDFKTPFYLLQKSRASPTCTVVHCSGGVGRSGTLVAIEMCLMQLAAGRALDVFDMVACLRRKRAQSVQTKEQYLFIFRC